MAEDSWPAGDVSSHFDRKVAGILKRGILDILFLGDTMGVGGRIDLEAASHSGDACSDANFTITFYATATLRENLGLTRPALA